jgi:hypothetical protein
VNDVAEARRTLINAINCVTDELPGADGKECIGFLLVAELMDEDKGRQLHVVSGMPNGENLLEVIGMAYVDAAASAYEEVD